MKLRRNEYCPIHRSLFCCGREQAKQGGRHGLAFSASKIHIILAGIASFVHQPRCASCSTGRLPSRAGNAESATTHLPTAAKSSPTISSREEWEQHDGTIIRITSRRYIDGAMEKKDRKEPDDRRYR